MNGIANPATIRLHVDFSASREKRTSQARGIYGALDSTFSSLGKIAAK